MPEDSGRIRWCSKDKGKCEAPFQFGRQFYKNMGCGRRRYYRRTFICRTSSVTALLYLPTAARHLHRWRRRWSRGKSRRGTHLSNPILTPSPEEFLIELFLGRKVPALALSDVRRVRAEDMSEDEVTNRTSSRTPTDTDVIALVIGHGKRADGGQRGERKSSVLALG